MPRLVKFPKSYVFEADTPEAYPEALTPEQQEMSNVTCQFLGKIYYLNDKICYKNAVWVCKEGGWDGPGRPCS